MLLSFVTEVHAAGSSFGTHFRVTTYGESHGGGVGCVIDGVPPRRPLSEADLQADLDRRYFKLCAFFFFHIYFFMKLPLIYIKIIVTHTNRLRIIILTPFQDIYIYNLPTQHICKT